MKKYRQKEKNRMGRKSDRRKKIKRFRRNMKKFKKRASMKRQNMK